MNCVCCDYGALSVVAFLTTLLCAKLPPWLSLTGCPLSIFCDSIPLHSSCLELTGNHPHCMNNGFV